MSAKNQASSFQPDYTPRAMPLERLPFVESNKDGRSTMWSVEPASYGEGCEKGSEYAAHFMQYLNDNPGCAGMNLIGHIASDIDFSDETKKGYWVGFFTLLQWAVYEFVRKNDSWAFYERLAAQRAKVLAAGELEEEPEDFVDDSDIPMPEGQPSMEAFVAWFDSLDESRKQQIEHLVDYATEVGAVNNTSQSDVTVDTFQAEEPDRESDAASLTLDEKIEAEIARLTLGEKIEVIKMLVKLTSSEATE